jgi:hypothetical protein
MPDKPTSILLVLHLLQALWLERVIALSQAIEFRETEHTSFFVAYLLRWCLLIQAPKDLDDCGR